jgi:hypothetical protein
VLEILIAVTLANAGLSGTVVEKGTRRKLAGIEVYIATQERSAVTDAEGRFSLDDLSPGEQEVVIAAPGYLRFTAREHLTENERIEVTYRIEREFSSGLEATVEGERERQELSHTRLGPAELSQTAGSQGDALKVVEDLPGVARTSPIGGGPLVIRGSNAVDSGVFLDGHPIPLLYHFYALTSTFNSDLIGAIDYLPGNFGVEHGDFTGGIVDVKSRAARDELHGYVKTSLIDAGALVEGNTGIKGLNFAIAGRRSLIDLVLRSVSNENFNFTTAPQYYDAQVRLDYHPPGSAHSLSLLGLISDDQLGLLIRRPADADPNSSGDAFNEEQFSQLRLRHGYHSGSLSLDTSLLVGTQYTYSRYANRADARIHELQTGMRSTASYRFSEVVAGSIGLDVTNDHLHYRARAPLNGIPREGDTRDIFRPDQPIVDQPETIGNRFNPAVWSELRLRLFQGFTLTPGVRFDAFTYMQQQSPSFTVSPRLAARWELSEAFALKAGAGLYTQGSRGADMTRAFGNPDLLPQRAWQTSLGMELRPIQGVLFTAEGFYKRLDHIPVRTNASVMVNGQPVPENLDNAGVGRIYGGEFLLRKELTDRLFGWISYTLSRSERQDARGQPWRLADYDQTHNVTAVISYKLPRGWQIGGRFRFISGNVYTPVLGSRYLASSDSYVASYGVTNSSRLPPFSQLDIRVDKTWTFDHWALNVFLDLLNAFNHRSIEGVAYSYDYANREFVQGLPIFPSIGVKGEF